MDKMKTQKESRDHEVDQELVSNSQVMEIMILKTKR